MQDSGQHGPAQQGTVQAGVQEGSVGSTPITGAEMGPSHVGEVAQGLRHRGKPKPLAREKRRMGEDQGPGLGKHKAGDSEGVDGGLEVDWVMWVLCLL